MPGFTKNWKRKKITKRFTKKRIIRKKKSTVGKPMTKGPFKMYDDKDPIGPKKLCKFTYCDVIGFTTGAGGVAPAQQVYNLNSLFDPDNSGVGHQPYYYDQMTAMYNRYKVSGCLVELLWTNPSADGIDCLMMVQPSSSTTSTLTGVRTENVLERPQVVVRTLNNSGSQKVYVKQYFDIATVEGLTKIQFKSTSSDIYCANTNASPSALPTIALSACSTLGNSGNTVNCNVKLTYYSQLYERIQPSAS